MLRSSWKKLALVPALFILIGSAACQVRFGKGSDGNTVGNISPETRVPGNTGSEAYDAGPRAAAAAGMAVPNPEGEKHEH
jgi:hypothetical protein